MMRDDSLDEPILLDGVKRNPVYCKLRGYIVGWVIDDGGSCNCLTEDKCMRQPMPGWEIRIRTGRPRFLSDELRKVSIENTIQSEAGKNVVVIILNDDSDSDDIIKIAAGIDADIYGVGVFKVFPSNKQTGELK